MSKERLVELICEGRTETGCAAKCILRLGEYCKTCYNIADHLLSNGVIVPPCNVGDYIIWAEGGRRELHQVKAFCTDPDFGLRYILDEFSPKVNHESIIRIVPREEAEAKLKEGAE